MPVRSEWFNKATVNYPKKSGFFKEQNADFSAQIDSDKTWFNTILGTL